MIRRLRPTTERSPTRLPRARGAVLPGAGSGQVRYTLGSLFSGIGGMDLGLERAGFEVRWQVEINPFRRAVLERHWPGVWRHDDVRTFLADAAEPGGLRLPERPWGQGEAEAVAHWNGKALRGHTVPSWCAVDLICGGFPCQPVSCAGKRQGDADARWLWPQMRRVCALVRPRWVLVENVRGLLSASNGRLFGGILRDLADLGYAVEWSCISAAAVGAPHIRDRVWILGHAHSGDDAPVAGVRGGAGADSARTCNVADSIDGRRRAEGRGRGEAHATGKQGRRSANGGALADAVQAESPRWTCLGPDAGEELAAFARGCRERYWRSDPADDPESGVGRVVAGCSDRVDRIAALGDSVVPQVAEFIGRRIAAQEAGQGRL